jgi:hypothetical protein
LSRHELGVINQRLTTDDGVNALAVLPNSDVFASTYGNGASGDQFNRRDFCWNRKLRNRRYRSADNGDSWTLASTGLTSTDIAALGINNNGHIFAATRSIIGERRWRVPIDL